MFARRSNRPRSVSGLIAAAQRRLIVNAALRATAVAVVAAAVLGLVLVVVDRATALGVPDYVYGVVAVVFLIAAGLYVWRSAPDRLEAARALDRQLSLKDRFGTVVAVESGSVHAIDHDQQSLAAMLQHDTQRRAAGIDLRAALPLAIPATWGAALAGAAALIAAVLFLPPFAWATGAQQDRSEQTAIHQAALQQQQHELSQSLQSTVDEFRTEQATDDPVVAEEMEAIDRLAEQLSQRSESFDPDSPQNREQIDELRQESAARLTEAADRIEQAAERDQQVIEELQQRFGNMPRIDRPQGSSEVIDALQRGDFERAAEEIEELLNQRESLDDDQRREAAEHLQQVAEHLQQDRERRQQQMQERAEQLRDALQQQGIEEQVVDELTDTLPQQSPVPPEPSTSASDPIPDQPDQIDQADQSDEADQPGENDEVSQSEVSDGAQDAADVEDRDRRDEDDPSQRRAEQQPTEQTPGPESEQSAGEQSNQPSEQDPVIDSDSAPDTDQQQPPGEEEVAPEEEQLTEGDSKERQPLTREEIEDELRRQGVDEDVARKIAEDIDRHRREREAGQEADRTSEEVERSLQETAEQLQQPPAAEEQLDQQEEPQTESSADDRQQDQQQQPDQQNQPDQQQQQEQQQQPEQPEQQSEQPQQQESEQPSQQSGEKQQEPGSSPQETQPGQQPAPDQEQQQEQLQEQSEQSTPDENQTDPQQQQQLQGIEKDQPEQDAPAGEEAEQQQQQQRQSPADTLRELQKRREQIEQRRERSRQLRERAREISEGMSDSERRRWAEQFQRQQQPQQSPMPSDDRSAPTDQRAVADADAGDGTPDGPAGSQPDGDVQQQQQGGDRYQPEQASAVDLTDDDDLQADRLIAEWFGDDIPEDAAGEPTTGTSTAERARQAREVAERAVNQSAVPRRYHRFLRDVFKRLDTPEE